LTPRSQAAFNISIEGSSSSTQDCRRLRMY
jgi:hypothetical protein